MLWEKLYAVLLGEGVCLRSRQIHFFSKRLFWSALRCQKDPLDSLELELQVSCCFYLFNLFLLVIVFTFQMLSLFPFSPLHPTHPDHLILLYFASIPVLHNTSNPIPTSLLYHPLMLWFQAFTGPSA